MSGNYSMGNIDKADLSSYNSKIMADIEREGSAEKDPRRFLWEEQKLPVTVQIPESLRPLAREVADILNDRGSKTSFQEMITAQLLAGLEDVSLMERNLLSYRMKRVGEMEGIRERLKNPKPQIDQ